MYVIYQWLVAGRWFSPGIPVSSTNKADRHNITEIFLKVALNTISQPTTLYVICVSNSYTYNTRSQYNG